MFPKEYGCKLAIKNEKRKKKNPKGRENGDPLVHDPQIIYRYIFILYICKTINNK